MFRFTSITFGFAFGCIFCALVGCGASSIFTKQVAKSAIDVALAACIAENAWMDEPALVETCKIANEVLPIAREIVDSYKKGVKKQAARAAKDGG